MCARLDMCTSVRLCGTNVRGCLVRPALQVAYVKGGMALWSSAGLPIEGGDGAEAEFAVRSAAVSQKTGTRSLRQAGTGGNKRFGLFGRRE